MTDLIARCVISTSTQASPKNELIAITEEVLKRNLPLIDKDEDYWVTQRISRGTEVPGGDVYQSSGPTLIVECAPLPLRARAAYFRDGIDVIVPSVRRAAPDALTPRAKTHNYLNLLLGDQQVWCLNGAPGPFCWTKTAISQRASGPTSLSWREMCSTRLRTSMCCAGVSRETVIEEAAKIGLSVVKKDIDLYDAYTADEAFITSTSFCACPVRSINGRTLRERSIPGPVTQQVIDAYTRLVGFDFVSQYLRQLG